jgi:hypothetical protein
MIQRQPITRQIVDHRDRRAEARALRQQSTAFTSAPDLDRDLVGFFLLAFATVAQAHADLAHRCASCPTKAHCSTNRSTARKFLADLRAHRNGLWMSGWIDLARSRVQADAALAGEREKDDARRGGSRKKWGRHDID